jgi:ABC-type dipeptide/oligopeptide/nickel transport system permease subunit
MGLSATELADAPPLGATEVKAVAGRSPTQIAFERLRKDRLAVVCAFLVLVLLLLGLLAPVITSAFGLVADASDANSLDPAAVLESDGYPAIGPPFHGFTWEHPLGIAPGTAVDNLAVLLYGLRTSLGVSFAATVVSTLIGVTLGLVAGFSRGWLDRVLSFIIDLLLSFPFILGALAVAPILINRFGGDEDTLSRAQVIALISILVVFGWMGLARLIRGQVPPCASGSSSRPRRSSGSRPGASSSRSCCRTSSRRSSSPRRCPCRASLQPRPACRSSDSD